MFLNYIILLYVTFILFFSSQKTVRLYYLSYTVFLLCINKKLSNLCIFDFKCISSEFYSKKLNSKL